MELCLDVQAATLEEIWSCWGAEVKAQVFPPSSLSLGTRLIDVMTVGCLRTIFGVDDGGLELGLDSRLLKTSSLNSSVFFGSRDGAVWFIRGAMSTLVSFVLFRGKAGFSFLSPLNIPAGSDSFPADWRSRGSVNAFLSMSLCPGGIDDAEQDLKKRFEFESSSSSFPTGLPAANVLDFLECRKNPVVPKKLPLATPPATLFVLCGPVLSEC